MYDEDGPVNPLFLDEDLVGAWSCLPVQFWSTDALATARAAQPETALMLAVLHDAMHILAHARRCGVGPRQAPLWRETVAWFTTEDWTWPYSAVNLCSALGLDYDTVRAWARRLALATPVLTAPARRRGRRPALVEARR